MKITTTAGTLKAGDKVGRRVVQYSTMHELGHCYLVYFEDVPTPSRYGRNETITVELFNQGLWYLRNVETKKFWHPIGSFYSDDRPKGFEEKEVCELFIKSEEERLPHELAGELEMAFLV